MVEQARCEAIKLAESLSFNAAAASSSRASKGFRYEAPPVGRTSPFASGGGSGAGSDRLRGAGGGSENAVNDGSGGGGVNGDVSGPNGGAGVMELGMVEDRKLRRVWELFSFLGIGNKGEDIPIVVNVGASYGSNGDGGGGGGGRGVFVSEFSVATTATTAAVAAATSAAAPSAAAPTTAAPAAATASDNATMAARESDPYSAPAGSVVEVAAGGPERTRGDEVTAPAKGVPDQVPATNLKTETTAILIVVVIDAARWPICQPYPHYHTLVLVSKVVLYSRTCSSSS